MLQSKLKLAALTVYCALGVSRTAAAQQTLTHTCRAGGETTSFQVQWHKWPALGAHAYAVKTINGSLTAPGWRLHHRPMANWPNNFFAPDTWVQNNAVIDYSVWEPLIPMTWKGNATSEAGSVLTCPDGGCISYPTRDPAPTGCLGTSPACITLYDYQKVPGQPAPKKVSVTGDSLILQNALCGVDPPCGDPLPTPNAPDYCATRLQAHLQNAGYRSYFEMLGGQGFYSWLHVIREQATTRPDIAVLAFGTNDAARQAGTSTTQARDAERLNTEKAVLASVRAVREHNPAACVVLVTAAERRSSTLDIRYRDEARQVNSVLRTTASSPEFGGNIQVADFAEVTRRYCGDGWVAGTTATCDWFDPDQLHLQGKGDDARNTLIMFALGHCR